MATKKAANSNNSGKKRPRRKKKKNNHHNLLHFNVAILVLLTCCFIALGFNLFHASTLHSVMVVTVPSTAFHHHDPYSIGGANGFIDRKDDERNGGSNHTLAGLSCQRFGGPSDEVANEMVYWSDIPSDASHVSPFHSPNDETEPQYLTFEPDGGGWNNIRMSMETVLALAIATGRILVLPPEQHMYLLGASQGHQRKDFSFQDFFPMRAMAAEHAAGLRIMTMKEFLESETSSSSSSARQLFLIPPPHNRTDWDGRTRDIKLELNPWLRSVASSHVPGGNDDWDPRRCVAAFPASAEKHDVEELLRIKETILDRAPNYREFVGRPVAVDASALERLSENWAARKDVCVYNREMQRARLVHFHGNQKLGARLLVHFYAFLFFQDWRQDLWMKRFVRDHVRYVDEIQCAAARIVDAVRERARSRGIMNGEFDSFHIRRGDFQYKKTRVEASEIYERSRDIIPEGSTVYIGTDERNKSFFDPLKEHWDIVFLDDFVHLVEGINTNYFGMIDQLVTSRGRYFFGCWFSTFTGYINRLRGYHAEKLRLPGFEDGVIESYYYALPDNKMAMREYVPVKQAFHAREFPVSWRGIDKGVGELDHSIDTSR